MAWGFALLVLVLLLNLTQSRVGRALRSIHGSEAAANAMGVNTAGYKLKTFVISAVLAAAAGCFLTHYNGGIGPSEAGAMKSVRYVALVAAGGMANLWGALVVSAILNFLSLRGVFGTYDHAVFGAMLIVIVSLAPDGPLQPLAPVAAAGVGADAATDRSPGGGVMVAASRRTTCARRFGGLVALDDVTFDVVAGQIKAVIGPNGAGKTTLFNIIAGVLRPRRRGRSVSATTGSPAAGPTRSRGWASPAPSRIGSLFPHMTVLENVMVGRHGRTRAGMLGLRAPIAAATPGGGGHPGSRPGAAGVRGPGDQADQPVGDLSFGQRRMVELARALATEPRIAAAGRAGQRPEHPRDGRPGRADRADPRQRGHRPAGGARHVAGHGGLRRHPGAELRGADRRRATPASVRNDPKVIEVYLGGEFDDA